MICVLPGCLLRAFSCSMLVTSRLPPILCRDGDWKSSLIFGVRRNACVRSWIHIASGDLQLHTDIIMDTINGKPEENIIIVEEFNSARVVTLNRPRVLNVINQSSVSRIIDLYKTWEDDDLVKLIVLKGAGRVFCAGGDLRMFYTLGKSNPGWTEVVYIKYWLDYHISTYKKPLIGLLHGLVMGGGAGLTVLGTHRIATEKTIFAMPEVAIGFHTDCGASYWLSRLADSLGFYLALTGARLNGAEMFTCGLATHYVLAENLQTVEKRLMELQSSDQNVISAAIEEFSTPPILGENSTLSREKLALIKKTFSKETVEEIIEALEAESIVPGQEWVKEPLKILKRSSPSSLKVTFKSLRTGQTQTLAECLKRDFILSVNCLRGLISDDFYEGIRAIVVEKDNSPKWNPSTLSEVTEEKLSLMFQPFIEEDGLQLPTDSKMPRWGGSYRDKGVKATNPELFSFALPALATT